MSRATARLVWDKVGLTVLLALVGGAVDAAGYLVLFQLFTAHMSGNSIALTVHVGQGQWGAALHRAFPIPVFVAGVAVGAVMSESLIRAGFRSTFAAALGLESLLLVAFILCGTAVMRGGEIDPIPEGRFYALAALPALAMGVQNASLRRVGGAMVRTTYITGMLTSFAEEAVQWLFWLRDRARGHRPNRLSLLLRLSPRQPTFNRMFLRLGIWLSYVLGGIGGAIAEVHGGLLPLLVPVFALGCVAVADLIRPIYPANPRAFTPDWKE